jgi:hypothetical protein
MRHRQTGPVGRLMPRGDITVLSDNRSRPPIGGRHLFEICFIVEHRKDVNLVVVQNNELVQTHFGGEFSLFEAKDMK